MNRRIVSHHQSAVETRMFQKDSAINTNQERLKLIRDTRQPTGCFDRLANVRRNMKVVTMDRLNNQYTPAKRSPCLTREEMYPVLFADAAGLPSNLYNVTSDTTARQLRQHATHDTGRRLHASSAPAPRRSKADTARSVAVSGSSVKSTTHGPNTVSSSGRTHGSSRHYKGSTIMIIFQPSKRTTASQNKKCEVDCGGARRRG